MTEPIEVQLELLHPEAGDILVMRSSRELTEDEARELGDRVRGHLAQNGLSDRIAVFVLGQGADVELRRVEPVIPKESALGGWWGFRR